ncbi:MAG TPA: hypothetical protein VI197_25555, partial [Polyangiaceae bacterium]
MRGRLFTLVLAAAAASSCLSVLAPDVDRALGVHAAVRETTAPSACITCHRPEPAESAPAPLPLSAVMGPRQAPWVPEWML